LGGRKRKKIRKKKEQCGSVHFIAEAASKRNGKCHIHLRCSSRSTLDEKKGCSFWEKRKEGLLGVGRDRHEDEHLSKFNFGRNPKGTKNLREGRKSNGG